MPCVHFMLRMAEHVSKHFNVLTPLIATSDNVCDVFPRNTETGARVWSRVKFGAPQRSIERQHAHAGFISPGNKYLRVTSRPGNDK
jgi:predicted glycosyl hydrolase (DUF1957 family)